jgi:hypothetical protein
MEFVSNGTPVWRWQHSCSWIGRTECYYSWVWRRYDIGIQKWGGSVDVRWSEYESQWNSWMRRELVCLHSAAWRWLSLPLSLSIRQWRFSALMQITYINRVMQAPKGHLPAIPTPPPPITLIINTLGLHSLTWNINFQQQLKSHFHLSPKMCFMFEVATVVLWNYPLVKESNQKHTQDTKFWNNLTQIPYRLGCGLDDRGSGEGWEFFSSPPRPERLWGTPSLLSTGYQGLFPWG